MSCSLSNSHNPVVLSQSDQHKAYGAAHAALSYVYNTLKRGVIELDPLRFNQRQTACAVSACYEGHRLMELYCLSMRPHWA
jgi:hypothetical protein